METHLPTALLSSLHSLKGFEHDAFIAAHKISNQITSVRFNPNKKFNVVHSALDVSEEIPWFENGFYLNKRPSFTLDPLFHAGAYYVQEASSMFLGEVLKQTCPLGHSLKVLDLCAAPGGKSTLIQSLLSSDSFLISNEVIKSRVTILNENVIKWGAANIVVTNNDPKDFQRLQNYFDIIVVDAPCSGSGLFRKDPEAVNEWSMDNVSLCSQRQQRILSDILPALKSNGILIYSTCSYSEDENEAIGDWLIDNHDLEGLGINIKDEWNITETISAKQKTPGYRFYPDKVKGEGFFISAFRKTNKLNSNHTSKAKSSSFEKLTQTEFSNVSKWINKDAGSVNLLKWKDDIFALPNSLLQEYATIQNSLYIKKIGVNIGTMIRNEMIPSHQLAMSHILSPEIPFIDLEKESALNYLRLNTINAENTDKGWNIVRFSERPLGFIKSLQNRINNYYPKEWRILHK